MLSIAALVCCLGLAGACGWRTTVFGSSEHLSGSDQDAGTSDAAHDPAAAAGPLVECKSDYRRNLKLLLDPPGSCVQSLGQCDDGHD